MPESKAPKMTDIKFAVPSPLLEDAQELAQLEGMSDAQFHRVLWEKGFAVHAEGSNARLLNRKLRRETAGDIDE